jgi:hypothetical protein
MSICLPQNSAVAEIKFFGLHGDARQTYVEFSSHFYLIVQLIGLMPSQFDYWVALVLG